MMFLFGGIPNIYYPRLVERALKELRQDYFTGLPLWPHSNSYLVDRKYCEELIRTLVTFVEGRPDSLNNGLGVVLLTRPWEVDQFEPVFSPFAVYKMTQIREPISRSGPGARRVANVYADLALSTADQLRKPVRAMTIELQARLRRTPLLLPIRHFDSEYLQDLIRGISDAVQNSSYPSEAIKAACDHFEAHHPFTREGRGGSFENSAGVKFKAPGRQDFHGRRQASRAAEHNDRCFLSARVRVGGFYEDGFHYDCTRGKGSYSGRFRNCHNAESHYAGRPHLNVYPNDFIR